MDSRDEHWRENVVLDGQVLKETGEIKLRAQCHYLRLKSFNDDRN
jgi:hypothetical protein